MKSVDISSPTIARLPLEVLEIFIQYSTLPSQLAIAQVSKTFHSLALRPLYRDISLFSSPAVLACCQTLTANHSAAKAVRSFMISYTYYSTNIFPAAYYSVIRDALRELTGLHTLKLLVHDPFFVTLLKHPVFPALHHFECYLTPSTALIKFLNRHTKINYLRLSPNEDTSDGDSSEAKDTLPFVELPRLQYFAGNAHSVPCLGTACALRAAILTWVIDSNPDKPFAALQRSSHATLNLLRCQRRGWNLDLIDLASIHLPHVVSLHIVNILLVDANPTKAYLQAIRAVLPRFTRLQRFNITCVDYWEMGDISCRPDEDFNTVTEWGDACPSLSEITLPHSEDLSWYRISENVWIPDPEHRAGAAWLSDAIKSNQHHKWDTIAESIDSEDAILNTTDAPPDFSETIANARSHLGELIRMEAGISSASVRSTASTCNGSKDVV